MATHWTSLFFLLISTGCKFDLQAIPVSERLGSSLADGGDERAGDAAPVQESDAGGESEPASDGGTHDPAAGPARYPGCASAVPDSLPAAPLVKTDANHRPLFDTFRDLDCRTLTRVSTCSANDGDAGCTDSCFSEDAEAMSLCVAIEPLARCLDQDMTVISAAHGSCRACATVETKARLCCDDAARFDCRAWPYDHDGLPGDVCARHDDCAPGLLCKDGGHGFGMCTCPESAPRTDDDNSCMH